MLVSLDLAAGFQASCKDGHCDGCPVILAAHDERLADGFKACKMSGKMDSIQGHVT